MGRERITRERGVHLERTHPAPERSRGPGGQAAHADGHGRGGDPLAYGLVVVLEEGIEDAAGRRTRGEDIDQAHQFGSVNPDLSGALGHEVPAAEHGGVVDLVADVLPAELDVGRRLDFLAPEPVEIRELGILEARDVDPLVELEGSRERLAHHHVALAERQAQEQVVRGDRPGLGGALATLTALASLATLALALGGSPVAHHLDGRAGRTQFFAPDRRLGGGELEAAGILREQDIGIGGLRRAGALAVHDADRGGRALLRAPDQLEIIPDLPLEIARRMVAANDEGHVELLVHADEIGRLDLDGGLAVGGQGKPQGREECCQFLHHQFFSFCRDFSSAAFSLFTLSWVSRSLAWMARSSCCACWGEIWGS